MATECIICTFPFDDREAKPITGSCGHSLCRRCCRTLHDKKCPICQRQAAFRAEISLSELVEVCKQQKLKLKNVKKQLKEMKAEKECSNQNRDKCSECGSSMEKQKSRLCSSCCVSRGIVAFHRENLKILDVSQTGKSFFCADCALDRVHKGHDIILYAPLKVICADFQRKLEESQKKHGEHLGILSCVVAVLFVIVLYIYTK